MITNIQPRKRQLQWLQGKIWNTTYILNWNQPPKKQACQSLWWIYLMGKYLIQTWILTHRTFIFFQLWFSAATTVASSAEWCFCRNQSPGWWCMSLLRWKQFLPNRFSNNMPLYFSYWILLKIIIIVCLSTAQNWSSRWRARTNGEKDVHIFENLEIQAKNRVWKLVSDINPFTPKISSVLFLLSAV